VTALTRDRTGAVSESDLPYWRLLGKIFGVSGGILGSKKLFRGAEPPETALQARPYHEF
jgi:hypothetical protein